MLPGATPASARLLFGLYARILTRKHSCVRTALACCASNSGGGTFCHVGGSRGGGCKSVRCSLSRTVWTSVQGAAVPRRGYLRARSRTFDVVVPVSGPVRFRFDSRGVTMGERCVVHRGHRGRIIGTDWQKLRVLRANSSHLFFCILTQTRRTLLYPGPLFSRSCIFQSMFQCILPHTTATSVFSGRGACPWHYRAPQKGVYILYSL